MSSAGPSRPRVVTLTADQLLGTSLTPTRPHNKHKNSSAPRVLTIEDLLGSGLTVARPPSRPAAPRSSPRPTSSRASGSSSNRTAPNPRLVRVTADEVLRTGIPVRTLQAVKARSQVLSAEELMATPNSRSSTQRPVQTRGRATVAQSGPGSSSGGSSGSTMTGANAGRSTGGSSTADSHGTRSAAPHASRNNEASGHSQSRNPRAARRSMSLGSMRTLPIYTQEPGDSEVVIDRGATELEDDDEIPITVMSPVDESEPNADNSASAGPTPSLPGSPSETEGVSPSRQLSPVDAMSPVASSLPNDLTPLPPWTSIYADAAPSYEAAMSTPNLHIYRERQDDASLPPSINTAFASPPISNTASASPIHVSTSPALGPAPSPPGSSTVAIPGTTSARPTVRVVTPQAPSATRASPGSRSPASPSSPSGERADGAETPRRRFGFMSIFHSRSSSRLRARSHSHSSAQAPSSSSGSAAPSPGRVASPDLLSPRPTRPFHRFSQSASGSMLNLSSCSRADN